MSNNKIVLSGIFTEGYGIIPKKLMRMKLNKNLKLILAYMLSYTGGGDTCFPGIRTIASDLELSTTTVTKYLKDAVREGLIIKSKYNDNPMNHANKYKLVFMTRDVPPYRNIDVTPSGTPKCQPVGVTMCHPVVQNNNTINNNNDNNKEAVNRPYLPLSKLLCTEHMKSDPKYRPGRDTAFVFNRWANDIRLLVTVDGRSVQDVEAVIKWCKQPGGFWVSNIMSGKKLRLKFPTLWLQYQQSLKQPADDDELTEEEKKFFED